MTDWSCYSSIKVESSAHLDAAMSAHCHSENWAESYQDLSSWCSAISASSPAICPSPVTDEIVVSDIGETFLMFSILITDVT